MTEQIEHEIEIDITHVEPSTKTSEELGALIQSEIAQGDAHYIQAGQHLAQAREMVKLAGVRSWADWLTEYCPSISRSWSYQLIAIGTGTKTLEDLRAATATRVAKHFDKKVSQAVSVRTNIPAQVEPMREFDIDDEQPEPDDQPEPQTAVSKYLESCVAAIKAPVAESVKAKDAWSLIEGFEALRAALQHINNWEADHNGGCHFSTPFMKAKNAIDRYEKSLAKMSGRSAVAAETPAMIETDDRGRPRSSRPSLRPPPCLSRSGTIRRVGARRKSSG